MTNLFRYRAQLQHNLKATLCVCACVQYYIPAHDRALCVYILKGREKGNLCIKTGINKCYTDTAQPECTKYHNKNLANKPYGNVAESEHLRTTATNRNCIHEKLSAMLLPFRPPECRQITASHLCVYSSRDGRN